MSDKVKPLLNKKQHEALQTIRVKLTNFRRKLPDTGEIAIHLEAAAKSLDNAVNAAFHKDRH